MACSLNHVAENAVPGYCEKIDETVKIQPVTPLPPHVHCYCFQNFLLRNISLEHLSLRMTYIDFALDREARTGWLNYKRPSEVSSLLQLLGFHANVTLAQALCGYENENIAIKDFITVRCSE